MTRYKSILFSALALLVLPITATAGIFDWQYIATQNYTVMYPARLEAMAYKSLYTLIRHRDTVARISGNPTLTAKGLAIPTIIEDNGVEANGSADPITGKLTFMPSNPGPYSPLLADNWLEELVTHEQFHMAQLLNMSPEGGAAAALFGNMFSPNVLLPSFLIEGSAVYCESQLDPYQGRLNDGRFDAIIAAQAASRTLPSVADMVFHPHYYPESPYGQTYLYGSTFLNYLATKYGKEKIPQLYTTFGKGVVVPVATQIGDFFPASRIDQAPTQVFGKGFEALAAEWQAYETANRRWIPSGTALTHSAAEKSWLTPYGNTVIYAAAAVHHTDVYTTKVRYQIRQLDLKKRTDTVLATLLTPVLAPMAAADGKLYFLGMTYGAGYDNFQNLGYATQPALFQLTLATGQLGIVHQQPNMRSIALKQNRLYVCVLLPSDEGSEIYELGEAIPIVRTRDLIGHISDGPGNTLVAAAKTVDGTWSLARIDLETRSVQTLIATPRLTLDARAQESRILFAANFDKTWQIYARAQNGQLSQLSTGGYFREPVAIGDRILCLGIPDLNREPAHTPPVLQIMELNPKATAYNLPALARTTLPAPAWSLERIQQSAQKGSILDLEANPLNWFPHTRGMVAANVLALYGEDLPGINQYQAYVELKETPVIMGSVTSKILKPLELIAGIVTENYSAGAALPLIWVSPASVLQLAPQFRVNNRLRADVGVSGGLSLADSSLGFDVTAVNLNLNTLKSLNPSRIDVDAQYRWFWQNGQVFLRWYQAPFTLTQLTQNPDPLAALMAQLMTPGQPNSLTLGVNVKLLDINFGMWNPSVFVGKLYVMPWVSAQTADITKGSVSTLDKGVYFRPEIQLGSYMNLLTGVNLEIGKPVEVRLGVGF